MPSLGQAAILGMAPTSEEETPDNWKGTHSPRVGILPAQPLPGSGVQPGTQLAYYTTSLLFEAKTSQI